MSDHDDIDIGGAGAGPAGEGQVQSGAADGGGHESSFAGHDAGNGMNHLAIPGLAGANTIAQANVEGSPRARRQARILGWLLIITFAAPVIIGAFIRALG